MLMAVLLFLAFFLKKKHISIVSFSANSYYHRNSKLLYLDRSLLLELEEGSD